MPGEPVCKKQFCLKCLIIRVYLRTFQEDTYEYIYLFIFLIYLKNNRYIRKPIYLQHIQKISEYWYQFLGGISDSGLSCTRRLGKGVFYDLESRSQISFLSPELTFGLIFEVYDLSLIHI